MDATKLLQESMAHREKITADRRTIHRAPEVGTELPQTVRFVEQRLREMGYAPRRLGGGVVAEITGKDTGRCVLLRADMDALKVAERPTLPSARKTGICTPAGTICTRPCCWARRNFCVRTNRS